MKKMFGFVLFAFLMVFPNVNGWPHPGVGRAISSAVSHEKQRTEAIAHAVASRLPIFHEKKHESVAQIVVNKPLLVVNKPLQPAVNYEASPLLHQGDKVAIFSHKSGKYLQVTEGKFLKPTGNSPKDVGCTFNVLKGGDRIGFNSSLAGNNNLMSVPGSREVKFENQNFFAWEHWFLELDNPAKLDAVYLKNAETNGYMSVRDAGEGWSHGGCVWTRDHTGGPATKGPYEKFKIEVVEPSPDTTKEGEVIGILWGVNEFNEVSIRTGITQKNPQGAGWKLITDKKLRHIAVSPDGLSVWGISDQDYLGGTEKKHLAIFFREGVTSENPIGTAWTQIEGGLVQISVGKDGHVWGVNGDDQIYIRMGITSANRKGTIWKNIEGRLKHVSIGADGHVWGVNAGGNIYFREGVTPELPEGSSWTQIPGGLKQITVGPGYVWGVNHADNIYVRTGITAEAPKGNDWEQVTGALKYVSSGVQGQVWGVNASNVIWFRENASAQSSGTGWVAVDQSFARLKQLNVGPLVVGTAVRYNLPPDWSREQDKDIVKFAVGSEDDGDFFALKLAKDGLVSRYDIEIEKGSPWVAFPIKDEKGADIKDIVDVACSDFGDIKILTKSGQIFDNDEQKKCYVPYGEALPGIDLIALSKDGVIWGCDKDGKNLYRMDKDKKFVEEKDQTGKGGIGISSSSVDGTTYKITENNYVRVYKSPGLWEKVKKEDGADLLGDGVAVGSKTHIYVTYQGALFEIKNNVAYQLMGEDGNPATSFSNPACNAAGTVFTTAPDGRSLLRHDLEGYKHAKEVKKGVEKTEIKDETPDKKKKGDVKPPKAPKKVKKAKKPAKRHKKPAKKPKTPAKAPIKPAKAKKETKKAKRPPVAMPTPKKPVTTPTVKKEAPVKEEVKGGIFSGLVTLAGSNEELFMKELAKLHAVHPSDKATLTEYHAMLKDIVKKVKNAGHKKEIGKYLQEITGILAEAK